MTSWRDDILRDFVPKVSKLTLVADPDGLLTEESLALQLRQRGFDLIEFHDAMEFRYAYESKYRSLWDRGEATDLVVILRLQEGELESLPYDLLQAGRQLAFSLGDSFPNLSNPVLQELDRCHLDALFEAQQRFPSERLGDNASRDYILRHVFGIAAELITNEVDLMRSLLRLHYGNRSLPASLAKRLLKVLASTPALQGWPLEKIIVSDSSFYAFLQEGWRHFVTALSSETSGEVRETLGSYVTRASVDLPESVKIPYAHQDVKVYIDNLFLEGKLQPIEVPELELPEGSWLRTGLINSAGANEERRILRLFEILEKEGRALSSARHADWIAFALKWAELSALIHGSRTQAHREPYQKLCDALNTIFSTWLQIHYASLMTLPPTTPAMLHHVARRMARDLGGKKLALVVMDGLSLDQWVPVREALKKQDPRLLLSESATFAWIPTLTSVSRQALFAGKEPQYFPSSLNSTSSEERLWRQFWEAHGCSRIQVGYQKGLGDGDPLAALETSLSPGNKVLGLVVDKVDKIMHGMQLGAAGMHNLIKLWCDQAYLSSLLGRLLDEGYEIWLTADHGNIEALGKGRPAEGVIAETRGERVRTYPTLELRAQAAAACAFAKEWPSIGLPENYHALVTTCRDAFVDPPESIVGHGGISMEEVIVPLIKIERRAL